MTGNENVNGHLQQKRDATAPGTCEDCMHSIRHNKKHDEVVCVPHLRNMPAANTQLCDLYAPKSR